MKDPIQLIGLAKARVDNGFSQVGRTLKSEDATARVLMLLASRSIAVANAVIVLAQHHHANEGMPLLRSLYELSVWMRWISKSDAEARAKDFLDEYKDPDWEKLWPTERLQNRMAALGFPHEVQERALLSAYDHLYGNALGLPWGHVFKDNTHKGLTPEEYLGAAAYLMGHVVKSLDLTWPGKFPATEWESTRGLE